MEKSKLFVHTLKSLVLRCKTVVREREREKESEREEQRWRQSCNKNKGKDGREEAIECSVQQLIEPG